MAEISINKFSNHCTVEAVKQINGGFQRKQLKMIMLKELDHLFSLSATARLRAITNIVTQKGSLHNKTIPLN